MTARLFKPDAEEVHCGGCGAPLPYSTLICARCWRSTGSYTAGSPEALALEAALPCYATLAALVTEVLGPDWKVGVGDEQPGYVCVSFRRKLAFTIHQLDLLNDRRIFSNGWEDVQISTKDPRFIQAAASFSHALSQKAGIKVTMLKRQSAG